MTWQARGRVRADFPGGEWAGGVLIVRTAEDLRVAFLTETGTPLVSYRVDDAGIADRRGPGIAIQIDAMVALLGRCLLAADTADGGWVDGRWRAGERPARWYGGDPVLLRAATDGPIAFRFRDHRLLEPGPFPHHWTVADRFLEMVITLHRIRFTDPVEGGG